MTILTAIDYVLGETSEGYETAEGFEAIRMPRNSELWGWGRFRRSSRSLEELRIETARRTLAAGDVDPAEIGAVIVCGAALADDRAMQGRDARLLAALGARAAIPLGLRSEGCDAVLSAIVLADALLARGFGRSVLVVGADKTPPGAARFQRYGLFSDAACSCLVTTRSAVGFDIVRTAIAADLDGMTSEPAFGAELAQRTNDDLLGGSGLDPSAVSKVFCNNIFLPILTLKEIEAGFEPEQIFTDNVRRIGHCYGCDALINLADHCSAAPVASGEHLVLAADAPGVRTSILLRARQAGAPPASECARPLAVPN